MSKAAMTQHLSTCGQPSAPEEPESGPSFHLVVEARGAKQYWLHVAVPASAPLNKVDRFLRRTWLECCGHMSAFRIDGTEYASTSTKPLNRALDVGMKFFHEYDFGSTTELVLTVVALRDQGTPKNAVQLLARNEPPQVVCGQCGERLATQICTECEWDDVVEFCETCAATHPHDEMFLPLVNSPRAGVCGYVG